MPQFIFGGNTGLTYQDLQRRQAILQNLQQRRSRMAAPQDVGTGLSAIGAALGELIAGQRVRSAEQQLGAQSAEILQSVLGGAGLTTAPVPAAPTTTARAPAVTGPTPLPALPGTTPAFDLPAARAAIGQIESAGSGDYAAVGPANDKGQRPYGRYQVMDFNVGPWTEEILGQRMTPEEFLADTNAQEQVFAAKFGEYVQEYGSPQEAASVWFTGEPIERGATRQDVLGTTGAQYVDEFNNLYQANLAPPTAAPTPAAAAPAPAVAPAPATAVPAAPMVTAGGGLPRPAATAGRGAPGVAATGTPGGFSPQIMQLLAASVDPRLSPQHRQIIGTLLQQSLQPAPRETLSPGDVLVNRLTGQQIAAAPFRPAEQYRLLTTEQAQQRDLDPNIAWQENLTTGYHEPLIATPQTVVNVGETGEFGKVAEGYQRVFDRDAQGAITNVRDIPIPGSPAAQKIARQEAQDEAAQRESDTKIRVTINSLEDALDIIDDESRVLPVTGFRGALLEFFSETASANLARKLETAAIGIGRREMNAVRAAGGTFGQITEKEWPKLEGVMGNLSKWQDINQLRANIEEAQAIMDIMLTGTEEQLRALGDRDVTQDAIMRRAGERAQRRAQGTPGGWVEGGDGYSSRELP